MLSAEAKTKLEGVTAATLTTCLFKRGFHNQYLQNVHPVGPGMPRMVGSAFTLRFIPAREDLDVMDAYKDPEHPQRKAVETISKGEVLVIDSRGDARGASAGDILLRRIMMRGAAGAVTDGGFRDTPSIRAMNFPVYQQRPSAPTGPIYHHALDFNQPIACGGAAVYPGDILVGDGEGVVVLPAHLAEELAHESAEMTAYEDWVEIQVMDGSRLPGIYPQSPESKKAFEAWRARKG
ncbi:MAG: ribonuclease activity regulator RraA [Geminicoccaceae bacterium]|nr:ribonuclease activity regulator RraA [Geminicoccaceae bacterium]MCB9944833.1 ribonuclease activity regulator RraA [Geminicoccaceae bacterium]